MICPRLSNSIDIYGDRNKRLIPNASLASALLVIGVGQSLMAARGTIVQSSGSGTSMAVGGAHLSSFALWSENVEFPPHAQEWASTDVFAEGGDGQSPLAGVANELSGYTDTILHSAAIGARTIGALHKSFHQVQAAVERGVSLLVDAGHLQSQIEVVFAIKHGEANATAGTSQSVYEDRFKKYLERCRLATRRALKDTLYQAKIHVSFPVQQKETNNDRAIKAGLLSQGLLVPGVYMGEVWSVPIEADRVHPTPGGYVLMGERLWRQVANRNVAMRCTSVTLSGNTFVATFNKPVVRDVSLGLFSGLNAANARDGLEFWDGSAFVQITNLIYSGNTVTGTLASSPFGGELRIACQDTTSTLTSDKTLHVGCAVRSSDAGWASTFDPSYIHYDWCIPQVVEVT